MEVDPKISEYFSKLAKKRTDKKRGFNNPDVVKRALETRRKNAEESAKKEKQKSKSQSQE